MDPKWIGERNGVLHCLREAIDLYLNLPERMDDSGNCLLPSTFAGAPCLEARARGAVPKGFRWLSGEASRKPESLRSVYFC